MGQGEWVRVDQRRGDRGDGGVVRAVLAVGGADTHERKARAWFGFGFGFGLESG